MMAHYLTKQYKNSKIVDAVKEKPLNATNVKMLHNNAISLTIPRLFRFPKN